MGNGAGSFYAEEDKSVLKSSDKVVTEGFNDRYRLALHQKEQFLEKQRRLSNVNGYIADMPYAQPMVMEKMERSLTCLDELQECFRTDQRKAAGSVEISTQTMCDGGVSRMCTLADDATMACAMSSGPIVVYNWKDGSVVSKMRTYDDERGHKDGAVTQLCVASSDWSRLASGDDRGYVAFWDLTEAKMSCEARLHEETITGLQSEVDKSWLISTSSDTYIMIYDANAQEVVERAAPTGISRGVPNTLLTHSPAQRKLILIGGKDGKLRIWTKEEGPLKEISELSCGNTLPVRCCVASDGYRCVVGTVPMDPASLYWSSNPVRSGVQNQDPDGHIMVFDLRMLRQEQTRTSVIEALANKGKHSTGLLIGGAKGGGALQRWRTNASRKSDAVQNQAIDLSSGVTDMTIAEEDGQMMALCLMKNVIKGYDLNEAGQMTPAFEFDPSPYDEPGATPQAIGCSGQYLFTASSAPSLSIWERTRKNEPFGHEDYIRNQPLPPLMLAAQYKKPQDGLKMVELGKTVQTIEERLRHDRVRTPLEMAGSWTIESGPRKKGSYSVVETLADSAPPLPGAIAN